MTRLDLLPLVGLLFAACAGPDLATDDAPQGLGKGADVSDLTLGDIKPDTARGDMAAAVELRKTDELPDNLRGILDDWHVGGFVWEVKRGEVLSDVTETAFLVDNLILLLFSEVRLMRKTGGTSNDAGKNRNSLVRVKSELSLCGSAAAESLAACLGLGDDFLASQVAEVLGNMGAEGAPAVAGTLDHEAALVRYRSLGILARLPGAGERELEVIAAMSRAATADPAEIVRVAAVQAMGERGLFSQSGRPSGEVDLGPWSQALEACLQDSAAAVREEAVQSLSWLGETSSVPALIAYGKTAPGLEGSGARKALESLTGHKFGTDFDAWSAWWDVEVLGEE